MAEKTSGHPCILCNTVLPTKEDLQLHFRKHANKEINIKGEPTEKPAQKARVKDPRVKTKNGENPEKVLCDVCSREFLTCTAAIQHKFKNHPEVTDKFYCPYCGMQFTIKSLFDKHLNNHSVDTRPKSSIRCEHCNAEFYFKEAQDYHNKATHARVMKLFQPIQTAPPSKKIKMNNAGEIQSVYYCHLCGSEYIVKFNLQKHLEKAHSEKERSTVPEGLFKCTTCDALFYNQKAYEIHNISHRPGDLYVTSEQQRLKTVTRVDQDFDIRRVLPPAHKYLETFKRKPRTQVTVAAKATKNTSKSDDEELSPPSSPDPSDSDSDSDIPLAQLVSKKSRGVSRGKN